MIASFDWLLTAPPEIRAKVVAALNSIERNKSPFVWELRGRPEQHTPPGDWRIWMVMAGRGFGKTRAGAEWVRMTVEQHPGARIALVSASLAEARAVMVEGESGLLGRRRRSSTSIRH